jgi:hypothetical protein
MAAKVSSTPLLSTSSAAQVRLMGEERARSKKSGKLEGQASIALTAMEIAQGVVDVLGDKDKRRFMSSNPHCFQERDELPETTASVNGLDGDGAASPETINESLWMSQRGMSEDDKRSEVVASSENRSNSLASDISAQTDKSESYIQLSNNNEILDSESPPKRSWLSYLPKRLPNKKRYYSSGKMTLTDDGLNDLVQYLDVLEANERLDEQQKKAAEQEQQAPIVVRGNEKAAEEKRKADADQELQATIAAQDKAMPVSYQTGAFVAGAGDVAWKVSNPVNDLFLLGIAWVLSFAKQMSAPAKCAVGEIASTVLIGVVAGSAVALFTRWYKFRRAKQVLLERRKVQISAVTSDAQLDDEQKQEQIEAVHVLYDEKLMGARFAAVDSGKAILGIWLSFKIATEVLSPAMPYLSALLGTYSLGAYYGVVAVVAVATAANYGLHMTRKFWRDEYYDRNKETFEANLKPKIDEELKAKGLLLVEGKTQIQIDVEKFIKEGTKTELLEKNKKLFKAELKRQQRVSEHEDKNLIDAERRQDIAMVRNDCLDRHRAKGLVYMESVVEGRSQAENLTEDSSICDRAKKFLNTSSEYVFRTEEKRIRKSMLNSNDKQYEGLKDKHDNELVPERTKSMAVVFGTIAALVIPFAPQILKGVALGKWALLAAGTGITAGFAMTTTSVCSFFGNRWQSHDRAKCLASKATGSAQPISGDQEQLAAAADDATADSQSLLIPHGSGGNSNISRPTPFVLRP